MCKSLGQQTFREEAKIVVSSSLQSECSLSFSVLLFLDAIHSFTHSVIYSFTKSFLIPTLGQAGPWGCPSLTWLRYLFTNALSNDSIEGQEEISVNMFPNFRPWEWRPFCRWL